MKANSCQSPPTEDQRGDRRLHQAMAACRTGIWEFKLGPGVSDPAVVEASTTTASLSASEILSSERSCRFDALPLTGNRLVLSQELAALLELAPGEFDGTLGSLLGRIVPAHRTILLRAFAKALRDGTEAEVVIQFRGVSRAAGWLLVRGRPQLETHNQVQRILGVAIEVTERKLAQLKRTGDVAELEHQLTARTNQLKATSQELDAFCYSISHDLRAPLRSIRGFNEVLLERYAAKLDDRGREFLRRACESSHSMERLIEDLLKLSRAGRAELAPGSVDLSQLATAVAETLRASAPERHVTFHITPGLKAFADERLMRIVLENLLGNAWKFTCHRPEALIEFDFAPAPAKAFFVRDNGAGFDPVYQDRLFGVFQRLHTESEFTGTGVGLAIVKRIVARHGGRVWAEGAIERGAAFYFSLPTDERT